MEIQVAIDVVELSDAVRLAQALVASADRIEVGTPLLLRHGTAAIEAIRAVAPTALIVADCKTMDGGALHARMAIQSGADGLIVQAAAPRATLAAACRAAAELDGFVMVDGLGVADIAFMRERVTGLPVSHVIVHVGKDEQREGQLPDALLKDALATPGLPPIAVAGGIDPTNVADVLDAGHVAVIIVGEAVYAADQPELAVRAIRHRIAELDEKRDLDVSA